ncbi:MAG: DUF4328 domain-containing protein [Akkermansiaceae bacterium]
MEQNPYTAPAETAPNIRGPYGVFRKNGALRNVFAFLVIVDSMVIVFAAILFFSGKSSIVANSANAPVQTFVQSLLIAQIAARLLSFVIFPAWLNRACKNAWMLDAPHIQTTPGWAAGYCFIPFLNLWKPYVVMKQIRRASYASDRALSKLLVCWWTAWLVFIAIGLATAIIGADSVIDEQTEEILTKLRAIRIPISLALNFLALALIVCITRAQNQRFSEWQL